MYNSRIVIIICMLSLLTSLVCRSQDVENIMVRVVYVTPDWLPYSTEDAFLRASPIKETPSLKIYDVAIWEENKSIQLYSIPNNYFENGPIIGDPKVEFYRESFAIARFDALRVGYGSIERSEFLRNAMKSFVSTLVKLHPKAAHHLEFNGHGAPGGQLFSGFLLPKNVTEFLSSWNQELGHKLGVIDLGGPCNMGDFSTLETVCNYTDYYIASDLINGNYQMNWTIEKYEETEPDYQYHRLFRDYNTLVETLNERINLKRKSYEYSREYMISKGVQQANYLYSCQNFIAFSTAFKDYMLKKNMGLYTSNYPGDPKYNLYGDLYGFLLNQKNDSLIALFNKIILYQANNRDFFDWKGTFNGMISPVRYGNLPLNMVPPFVKLPSDIMAKENDQLLIEAKAYDIEGDEIRYSWRQLSGPYINLENGTSAKITFVVPKFDKNNILKLSVSVDDGKYSISDTILVLCPLAVDLSARILNLDSLFISKPSDAERDEIINSFHITLKDGDESYAKWSLYDPYYFNPDDTLPSIYPLINSLRVIREQKFSESLPFTDNAYQYMLSHFSLGGIELALRSGYHMGGDNRIFLAASHAFWNALKIDSSFAPQLPVKIQPYYGYNRLLIHETRHSDIDDPGHDPNNAGKDTRFSLEGANARTAIYSMWVYKYGLNFSQSVKLALRDGATIQLMSSFIEMPPSHPNPKVQDIINEFLPKIGIQSGNNQVGNVDSFLQESLNVNMYNNFNNEVYSFWKPIDLIFQVISTPINSIGTTLIFDSSDIISGKPASVRFKFGDKPGKYIISAKAPSLGMDSVLFSLTANTTAGSHAGIDQSVNEGATASLDGSASTDPDGDALTYKWTAPVGITLSSTSSQRPTFTAPEVQKDTTLIFTLIVNDGFIDSETSTVKISVKNLIKTGSEISGKVGIKVFPNPTNGFIKMEGLPINQKNKISIYTIEGNLLIKRIAHSASESIDISDLVTGIYMLSINNQRYMILKE